MHAADDYNGRINKRRRSAVPGASHSPGAAAFSEDGRDTTETERPEDRRINRQVACTWRDSFSATVSKRYSGGSLDIEVTGRIDY